MKKTLLTTAIFLTTITGLRADHGPGTSGSGFTTQTAETIQLGKWGATVSHDWTEFGGLNSNLPANADHLDLIDRSHLTTFGLSLGVTQNLQIGLNFGYYAASGTRQLVHNHGADEHEDGHHSDEHHAEEGNGHSAEKLPLASFDPDGWTDMWITGKYRLYRGPAGQFSIVGGVKVPVGETRVFDSRGGRVEPASTPGSGAWDGMLGAAYTLQLSPSVALDASAQYTFRGEKYDYRLGNRFDAGAALGWRVLGSAQSYPQVHLLGEASFRHISRSDSLEGLESSTGGTVLFLSPGARISFSPHAGLTIGAQLPVMQDLNGVQVETHFRISTSMNISF